MYGRICKYIKCTNYNNRASTYCCNACAGDAYDDERLEKEERQMERLKAKIIKDLELRIKDHKANLPIKLEKKTLELILELVKADWMDICCFTNIKTIITKALEEYCAYLKEDLF